MKSVRFGQRAFGMAVAVAFVAGCGGAQTDGLPVGNGAQAGGRNAPSIRWNAPNSQPDDLIYTDHFIFAYPGRKKVGTLDGHYSISGMCSDSEGNVFIPASEGDNPPSSAIYEFAHGGTAPMATFNEAGEAAGCAVDPKTASLAVTNFDATVAIFPRERGHATYYPSAKSLIFCTFDNSGDLFVSGYTDGSIQELPAGQSSFIPITLNKKVKARSLQWYEQSLIASDFTNGVHLYRVSLKGSYGRIIRTTSLDTRKDKPDGGQYWIHDKIAMGPFGYNFGLALWNYPGGGPPTGRIGHKRIDHKRFRVWGLAFSVAPSH